VSPQRAHAGPLCRGNSDQQALQIGAEDSCGRGEPQRVQKAGRRAQLKASMGLRSTRATARHRVVSDGGTSNVSEPESLRKTHLTLGPRGLLSGLSGLSGCVRAAALRTVYPEEGRDSIGGSPRHQRRPAEFMGHSPPDRGTCQASWHPNPVSLNAAVILLDGGFAILAFELRIGCGR
jgi:hypothetical protein